jgi:YVTN family beta-propeller protein
LSMLSLEPDAKVVGTVVTGANPFEVTISPDSKTAYVSNFLGDTISIVDLGLKKTVHSWRSGKQPAMIALEGSDGKPGGSQLVVANTSSADVWIINATTGKLVTRVPVGQGAHGVVSTPSGKLYITNSTDNTVTVIDGATNKAIKTLAVANNPNGLTYMSTP